MLEIRSQIIVYRQGSEAAVGC